MNNNIAIEMKNVSKNFKVETRVYGDNKKKSKKSYKINTVLDDISLEIKKGDVVGIIGRNGSGKSTFLKIVSRIMEADKGSVQINGKIASILELGMGFHPDMSGRENIYIKGEMYGFSKKIIDDKVESIIKYSGIEKYIDNPLRTYSTGMKGRLAFAIMANVDADIYLVDEILSVGDVSFASKAIDYFKKMSKSGKTVLFVSHSLNSIEQMCNRTIWIENGKIVMDGNPKKVCSTYNNKMLEDPDILQDLAMSGLADAQYRLALMYRDGINFEKNNDMYTDFIRRSAEQGHIKAQIEYADYLVSLEPPRTEEAIEFYRSAANRGDQNARIRLAKYTSSNINETEKILRAQYISLIKDDEPIYIYKYATFLKKISSSFETKKEAFEMMKKASDLGNNDATYQLALMYRDSFGTKKDISSMKDALHKASDDGHINSTLLLASMYDTGTIIERDENRSFELYLKAANAGNLESQYKIAMKYSEPGEHYDPEKGAYWFDIYLHNIIANELINVADIIRTIDPETSYRLYKKALQSNNLWAAIHMLDYTNVPQEDLTDVCNTLTISGKNGNTRVCRTIGDYYIRSNNEEKSIEWYERAVIFGDILSITKLGELYKNKDNTNDLSKSISILNKAAKLGSAQALQDLIEISLLPNSPNKEQYSQYLTDMEQLANNDNIEACRRLGIIYQTRNDPDYTKALFWYEKGNKIGDPWCKLQITKMKNHQSKDKSND